MRCALVLLVAVASTAHAGALELGVAGTVSGRWVEGLQVATARERLVLEGSDLCLGGAVELGGELSRLRLGALVGVDVVMSPRSVAVLRTAPLGAMDETGERPSSLLFFSAAPFVGYRAGDGFLRGWVDLLLGFEVASARVDTTRFFGLTAVPTLRLGTSVDAGGTRFSLSLLASYFGAARLSVAFGVHL